MDDSGLSAEDKEFLEKCEEELKERYTDKDEEFMKVFNREPTVPPILEKWWVSSFTPGRRNDNRYNRQYKPYQQRGNRDYQGRSNSDHRRYNNHHSSYGPQHSRYSNY